MHLSIHLSSECNSKLTAFTRNFSHVSSMLQGINMEEKCANFLVKALSKIIRIAFYNLSGPHTEIQSVVDIAPSPVRAIESFKKSIWKAQSNI